MGFDCSQLTCWDFLTGLLGNGPIFEEGNLPTFE